jgi:hypothetical protein
MKKMVLEPPPIIDPMVSLELDDGEILDIRNIPEPIAHELIKRWNAFDELLDFMRRYISCSSAKDRELYERLTKYDVPSTEDKV